MNLRRTAAVTVDAAMCAMMYALQRRHHLGENSRALLADYVTAHQTASAEEYFAAPPPVWIHDPPASLLHERAATPFTLRWRSPVLTGHVENNLAFARYFPGPAGFAAPTVLLLHALMSTSDRGYHRWAADFNARGWNACFVHLPYHYSRRPAGAWNGELAITADLVRNAEGLRQGVIELRQLLAHFRGWGCKEFGLWASSYGGWLAALLTSVERGFRFAALMEPIVNVDHAIWTSPAGAALRRRLPAAGIEPELIERHFRLISPLHVQPLDAAAGTLLCAGNYDRITDPADIVRLHRLWPGSELLEIAQGHFGYRMMPAVWERLIARGLV